MELSEQVLGFAKSHPFITVSLLAAHLNISNEEAKVILDKLVKDHQLISSQNVYQAAWWH